MGGLLSSVGVYSSGNKPRHGPASRVAGERWVFMAARVVTAAALCRTRNARPRRPVDAAPAPLAP